MFIFICINHKRMRPRTHSLPKSLRDMLIDIASVAGGVFY